MSAVGLLSSDGLASSGFLERVARRVDELVGGATAQARLAGRRSALLFLEPSTRTVLAFGAAIEALGGVWVRVDSSTSSLVKQESLRDTLRVLAAQGTTLVVVRAPWVGTAALAARYFDGVVVNAGDGVGEHPSQAVQDACVIARARTGRAAALESLQGLRVAIVGDVRHSRVARSVGRLLAELGTEIVGVAPRPWQVAPAAIGAVGFTDELDDVVDEVDVLYMLRIQRERLGDDIGVDLAEYVERFQLSGRRLDRVRPGALVLHPGPVNRGVELDDVVLASSAMRDGEQYALGVPSRVALLEALAEEAGWAS
jgi:aspartate carbamoyltransferase catalytic subunit